MRRFDCLLLMGLLLAGGSTADAGDRLGVGVKVGTLGFGADLTARISDRFAVRGSINAADISHTYEDTDVDYDGDLKLGAYGALVDFHPMKGNFRLTAGLMKNRNEFELTGQATQNVTIGNNIYTPGQVGTLSGSVGFNDTAPYFGIGYGNAVRSPGRVRLILDVGVLRQGSGDVSLSATNSQIQPSDLQREESDIEDDIESFDLWPVIALGVSVRL